jgi:cell shape-determining protein MreC
VFGVLEESGEAGIVVGQGQEDLRMDLVTAGTPVTANERVFTKSYELNGQRGIFPPGLLIGEVSSARGMEGLLEETVRVRPAVDFATLDYVLVLVTEEGLSD